MAFTGKDMCVEVVVQLRGFLSRIVDEPKTELDVPHGVSVADVVVKVANHYGEGFRKVVLDGAGGVYGGMVISINEKVIPYQRLSEITIEKTCLIILTPLAAGG